MPASFRYAFFEGEPVYYNKCLCERTQTQNNTFHSRWAQHINSMIPKIEYITRHKQEANGDIEMSWIIRQDNAYEPVTRQNLDHHDRLDMLFTTLVRLQIDIYSLHPDMVQIRRETPTNKKFSEHPSHKNEILYSDHIRLLACWQRTTTPPSAAQIHLCKSRFRIQLPPTVAAVSPSWIPSYSTSGVWKCQEYDERIGDICDVVRTTAASLCSHLKAAHDVEKGDLQNEVYATVEDLDHEAEEDDGPSEDSDDISMDTDDD